MPVPALGDVLNPFSSEGSRSLAQGPQPRKLSDELQSTNENDKGGDNTNAPSAEPANSKTSKKRRRRARKSDAESADKTELETNQENKNAAKKRGKKAKNQSQEDGTVDGAPATPEDTGAETGKKTKRRGKKRRSKKGEKAGDAAATPGEGGVGSEMTEATTAVDAEVLATDGLAGDAAGTPGESDGATGKKKRRGKKRRSRKGEKAGDAAATPGESGVGSEMTEATTAVDAEVLATDGLAGDAAGTPGESDGATGKKKRRGKKRRSKKGEKAGDAAATPGESGVGSEMTEATTAVDAEVLATGGLAGDAAGTPGGSDGATGKKKRRGKKRRSRKGEKAGDATATPGESGVGSEMTEATTAVDAEVLATDGLAGDAAGTPGESDGATGKKKRRGKKRRSRKGEKAGDAAATPGEGGVGSEMTEATTAVDAEVLATGGLAGDAAGTPGESDGATGKKKRRGKKRRSRKGEKAGDAAATPGEGGVGSEMTEATTAVDAEVLATDGLAGDAAGTPGESDGATGKKKRRGKKRRSRKGEKAGDAAATPGEGGVGSEMTEATTAVDAEVLATGGLAGDAAGTPGESDGATGKKKRRGKKRRSRKGEKAGDAAATPGEGGVGSEMTEATTAVDAEVLATDGLAGDAAGTPGESDGATGKKKRRGKKRRSRKGEKAGDAAATPGEGGVGSEMTEATTAVDAEVLATGGLAGDAAGTPGGSDGSTGKKKRRGKKRRSKKGEKAGDAAATPGEGGVGSEMTEATTAVDAEVLATDGLAGDAAGTPGESDGATGKKKRRGKKRRSKKGEKAGDAAATPGEGGVGSEMTEATTAVDAEVLATDGLAGDAAGTPGESDGATGKKKRRGKKRRSRKGEKAGDAAATPGEGGVGSGMTEATTAVDAEVLATGGLAGDAAGTPGESDGATGKKKRRGKKRRSRKGEKAGDAAATPGESGVGSEMTEATTAVDAEVLATDGLAGDAAGTPGESDGATGKKKRRGKKRRSRKGEKAGDAAATPGESGVGSEMTEATTAVDAEVLATGGLAGDAAGTPGESDGATGKKKRRGKKRRSRKGEKAGDAAATPGEGGVGSEMTEATTAVDAEVLATGGLAGDAAGTPGESDGATGKKKRRGKKRRSRKGEKAGDAAATPGEGGVGSGMTEATTAVDAEVLATDGLAGDAAGTPGESDGATGKKKRRGKKRRSRKGEKAGDAAATPGEGGVGSEMTEATTAVDAEVLATDGLAGDAAGTPGGSDGATGKKKRRGKKRRSRKGEKAGDAAATPGESGVGSEMTEATTAVDAEVLATDGLAGDAAGTPGESDGATGKKRRRGKKRRSRKGEKAGDAAATPGEGGVGSEMTEATTAVDAEVLATDGLAGDAAGTPGESDGATGKKKRRGKKRRSRKGEKAGDAAATPGEGGVGSEMTEATTAVDAEVLATDGLAGDAAGTPGESDGATGKKKRRGKKRRSRKGEKAGDAAATPGEGGVGSEMTEATTAVDAEVLATGGLAGDAAGTPGESDGATGKKKRRGKKRRSRKGEKAGDAAATPGESGVGSEMTEATTAVDAEVLATDGLAGDAAGTPGESDGATGKKKRRGKKRRSRKGEKAGDAAATPGEGGVGSGMTEATTAVDAEVLATDGLAGDAAGTPGESDGATGKKKRRGKKRRSRKGEKAGDAAATPGEGGVGSEMTEATTAVDAEVLATGGLPGDVSVTREVGTEVTEDKTAAEIDQLGSDGLAGDAAGTPGDSDGATGKKRKRGEKKHRSRRREKRGRAGATRGETAADAEKTKKTTLAVLDLLASGLTSDAAAMPGDSDGATGKKRKRREKKHRSRRRERSSKVATLAGEGDAVEGEMPQDEGVVEVAASGDDTSTRSVAQEGLDSVKNAKKTHRKRSRTHKRKTADDKTASEHASEAGKFLLAPETGPTVSEESLAPGEATSPENTEQVASDVRQETDTGESEAAMMLEKEDDDAATGGSEEDEVLMPQDEEAREQDAGDNLVSEHGLEADEAVSAGESPTSESTEQVTSALPPATDDETQEASKKAKRRTAKKSRSKKREKSSEDMEAEARSMSGQHGKKKAGRRRSQKPESSGYSRSVEESRSTDADSQSRGRHDQTLSSLRRRRKNIGSATEEAYMDGDESISEASATQKKHMTTESRRRRKGSREAGGGFDEWVFQSDDDESIDYSAERSRSTRRRRADRDGRDRKGRERRHMSSRSRHSEELSESPNSDSETRAATEDGETSRTSRRSHRRPFTMSMLDDEYDDELRDADDLDEWSISSYPGAFEEIRRHSETGHRYGHNIGVPGSQRNREEREISILDPFYPPSQHVPQADFLTQDSPSQRPNAAQLTALIQAGVAAVQAVDKVAGKAHGEAPQSQLAGPGTAVGKTQSASHEQKDAARAAARTLNLEAVAKLLRGHHSDARASTQSVGALLHRNYSRLGPSATESARKLHWENLMTALTAPHLRQPELYRSSSKHRSERRGIDGLDDIVRNRDSLTFAQDRSYESKESLTPDSPVYEDGWSRRASRSRMESEDSMSVDWLHKKHESRLSQRRRLEKQRHRSSKSRGEDRDETFDDADSGKDGQRRRPGHIVAFEDSYSKASHLGDVELVDDEELSTDIEQLHSKMKEELTRDGELEASWGSSADLEGETAQIAQGENWDDGWEKVEESEAVMEPAEVQESLLQRDAPETDDGWMQTPVDPGDWKRAIMEVLKSGHVSGDVPLKQWLPGDSWQEFSGLMSSISDVVRGQHTDSTSSERFGALRMAKKEEKPLVQMDDSCFERNVRYSPGSEFIVVWRGVPTASHCQALCKLTAPECHFFSFVKSAVLPLEHQGACYLLPRKAPVVRVPSRGVFEVTSGPRSCSPPTPDSPPLDLVAVTSRTGCPSSPSVCDSLNLPFPLGSRFSPFCSTSKEGHCANLANGIPCCTTCNDHPGNPCPEKTCYEYNVDYTDGTELRFFAAGVASRGACESLCRQTEGCTHYSYYSTPQLPRHLRGSCSLRAFRFAPRNRVTVEGLEAAGDGHSGATRASVVFAPLFCEYPQTTTTTTTTTPPPPSSKLSCNRPNTDFWGHDLASFKGCVSADACQRICQSVDGCVGFTYVKLMQKCYLKWSATVERHVEGHESGPRCCAVAGSDASSDGDGAGFVCPAQRKKPCVFAGQDYPGHDITIKLDTVSAYKCFQLCKAERRCEVWTHRPEKKMCFLKWAEIPFYQTVSEKRLLLQEEFVVAPGAITGFADCEPFYGPDADKFTVPEAQAKAEAMRILSQNLRYGRDEGSTTGAYEETTNNGRKEYARPLSRSRRRGMSEDESTSRRSRSAEFSEDEESVTRRRRLKRRTRPVHQDSEEETHSMTAHRKKRKHRSKRKHSTMDEEEDFQTKRKRAHRQGRS